MLNESLVSMVLIKDDQKFLNNKLKHLYNTLEISLFGLEQNNSETNNYRKLVFHKSVFDDCFEGDVKFQKDLLKENKNFELLYNYDDLNFYVFNKLIFKILDNEHIKKKNHIKNEFIPFIINKSYKKILTNLIYGSKKKENIENEQEYLDISKTQEKSKIFKTKKKKVNIMAMLIDYSDENYA